jgi:hypothetical protein
MPAIAQADGSPIDKVYHPYVQPDEREFEWRAVYPNDGDPQLDNAQKHRFAYGQSINERWFGEIYLIGEKNNQDSFSIEEIELEATWQITEQGEYDIDWGMLFEYERSFKHNFSEVAIGLLADKQWGRWVGTANVKLIYEGGKGIEDEFETSLASQLRYRYSRQLEPAIEFYSGEDGAGIGPVLLGNIRLGGRKQLRWEAGIVAGLDNKTANNTLRFLLEYEF